MLKDAHLGWSYLEYEDGWPAAKYVHYPSGEDTKLTLAEP
jgi:hypothetical protein